MRLDQLAEARKNEREAQAVRELHKVADKLQGEGPVGLKPEREVDEESGWWADHFEAGEPEGECEECDQVAGHLPFCGLAGGEV